MMVLKFQQKQDGSFNMTPIIDVVFLLIIFFMLVCQFIVAENFDVIVPDKITSAQDKIQVSEKLTTVTVMFDDEGDISYAVGSERIYAEEEDLPYLIAEKIDMQLSRLPDNSKTVNLRIDKDIDYKHSQYALAAISSSIATDIKMAVTK
ncbi:MAG: biopolymer transporter ExbD [Sedimentisphaerales bacterium]|nr:biopolymer transporter ExbD [Sedimentisphaerales bacterium]